MQTFTRQVNQGLVIGDNLHVTVLEIQENHVRIGITCPDSDPPYWEEILYAEPARNTRRPVEVS
jgi:carbon storage regulator CsrA